VSKRLSGWRDDWRRARWLGPLVRERRRFMLNEALRRGGLHEYRLASHDATIVLRHNGYDAHVLHEVMRDEFYSPPAAVRELLSSRDGTLRALDLGGNIGCFGLLVLEMYPSAVLTAFEPDPSNLEVLKRCIARNGYEGRWQVVEACAAAADGETSFVGGQAALSRIPLPGDVTGDAPTLTVPMVDVFPYVTGVDLVKIDIEGGEWALLNDPRFDAAHPGAILLEWHSYDCPGDNPRRVAAQRLEALGYTVLHEKPAPVPDSEPLYGAGTLWAWRGEEA
jgi:FkbM family methyltransferase